MDDSDVKEAQFSLTVGLVLGFFPYDKNLRGDSHEGGFDPRGRHAALFRVEKYF